MFQWMHEHGPDGFWYKVGRAWDLARLWVRKRKVGGGILAAFILIAGLWATSLYLSFLSSTHGWPQKIEGMGQVGDSFGAVNSLFTGLTLFFLVYTIHLQRREIVENRRSIAETSRDQYIAARLNAAAAMLEAYDRDAQCPENGGKAMERYVSWERDRLRQALKLLQCESRIYVSGRWTSEHEVMAVLMMFRDLFLACDNERRNLMRSHRSKEAAQMTDSFRHLHIELLQFYQEWQDAIAYQNELLAYNDNILVFKEAWNIIRMRNAFTQAVKEFAQGDPPRTIEGFDSEPVNVFLKKTLNEFLLGPQMMIHNLRDVAETEVVSS